MVSPAIQRKAVKLLQSALSLSERRACRIIGAHTRTVRYQSKKQDAALTERIKAIAAERPRFGYKRIHICQGPGHENHPGSAKQIHFLSRSA